MGRLYTERHPGVWHNGGLESDGAFKAEVWVKAVMEGGRRFMAAWREEELRRRGQTSSGEERGNERDDWESCYRTQHGRSVEFCEATPIIGLADES